MQQCIPFPFIIPYLEAAGCAMQAAALFMLNKDDSKKPAADISCRLVRMKGLEPIRPETLDPKSNAATNYATCA